MQIPPRGVIGPQSEFLVKTSKYILPLNKTMPATKEAIKKGRALLALKGISGTTSSNIECHIW